MIAYETRLNQDRRWALREGSMHFERESAVYKSLEKIVRRLEGLGMPFAVVGGMALFLHGYRRFTEDVDILVRPDGLKRVHEELEGRGYVPPFAASHGCIRLPQGMAEKFYNNAPVGTPVVVRGE